MGAEQVNTTVERELGLEKRRATWDREHADAEVRKAIKLAIERTESFLRDSRAGTERVLALLDGGAEEKAFGSSLSDRAGWVIDTFRNFVGNQLDVLRNVQKFARDIEDATRRLAILSHVKVEEQ